MEEKEKMWRVTQLFISFILLFFLLTWLWDVKIAAALLGLVVLGYVFTRIDVLTRYSHRPPRRSSGSRRS